MDVTSGGEYVALGSSFGAGPGLKPRAAGAPRASGRSDRNYAHLAATRLGLDLDLDLRDVTFSGATTADILKGTRARAAQVDAVGRSTRLVTITAGGNDVGYLPALTLASLPRPIRMLPQLRRRVAAFTDPNATEQRFDQLAHDLAGLLRTLRSRAPEATIVLVDYLTILPPAASAALATDRQLAVLRESPAADLTAWGRHVAQRLSSTFAAAATAEGCDFLPVGELSRDHHAWSAEPWTRRFHLSLRGGAPFHPTAAGMAAVADLLVDHLNPRP
ncbi:SGNH/GDSL hydrolase family protein [Herbiconiux solani]|uniref:SGNH/GDSL hydrolase family protein n=1 Tax=Herbiconiux solani TaxID=661329 RepID=UPI0008259B7E|nr:SGNH/GDSL hydrolase family protein [Herbiconiux solani]